MGFYLLDRPNPYGPNYYPTRQNRLLAIVVHITAGADDLDALDDLSAENVSHYAATTDRDVSWHSGSDADSWVFLLPAGYTAWHASNYNSCTYGHEISKRTTDWRNVPQNWIDKTLRMAALGPDGRSGLRKIALDDGIPLRWATKAELDHARATGGGPVGFITHHEVQSADRTDPGYVQEGGRLIDTFPRARFMALLNQQEEDDMYTDADRRAMDDLAHRVAALTQMKPTTAGGVSKGEAVKVVPAIEDLAYRVEALVNARDTQAGGTSKGQAVPLVATVKAIAADVAAIKANAAGPAIDYDQLAAALARAGVFPTIDAIADEMDRRARDNDHTTGPTS